MTAARGPEHVTHKLVGIEQQRRDFMRDQPGLYRYIENITSARVLDSAGDQASGATDAQTAANRLWRFAAQCRQDADQQRAAERQREEGE